MQLVPDEELDHEIESAAQIEKQNSQDSDQDRLRSIYQSPSKLVEKNMSGLSLDKDSFDVRRQNESILKSNMSKNKSSLLSTIKKIDETARNYKKGQ